MTARVKRFDLEMFELIVAAMKGDAWNTIRPFMATKSGSKLFRELRREYEGEDEMDHQSVRESIMGLTMARDEPQDLRQQVEGFQC